MIWGLLGIVLVLLVIDYGQTRDIKNHLGFTETNLILGRQPSDRSIITYFAICVLMTVGLAALLPSCFDAAFLGVVCGMELLVVFRNRQIGLRVKLHG